MNCGPNEYMPMSASSCLRVDFSKEASLEDVVSTTYHVRSLFQYITYRINIHFNAIEVYYTNDEGYKDYSGVFVTRMANKEKDKKAKDRIIGFEYLGKNVSKLLCQIKNKRIVTIDYCNSIDDRLHLTNSKIIMILSKFEGEFGRAYGKKGDKSEAFLEAKDDVLKYIEKRIEQNTRKKKKAYKGLYKGVLNSGYSFGNNVIYALDNNKQIMDTFVKRMYYSSLDDVKSDIASRMNIIRNDIAHNKLEHVIKAVEINDLRVLELLTYAMRLRKIGVSINNTCKALDDLFF